MPPERRPRVEAAGREESRARLAANRRRIESVRLSTRRKAAGARRPDPPLPRRGEDAANAAGEGACGRGAAKGIRV